MLAKFMKFYFKCGHKGCECKSRLDLGFQNPDSILLINNLRYFFFFTPEQQGEREKKHTKKLQGIK